MTTAIDLVDLERRLAAVVSGGVRFDAQARAVFATDASNYRVPPLGVVFPRSTDEVVAAVAACRDAGASVVPRGTGTSIAGNAIGPGVVIDCSRFLDRVVAIDPSQATAFVEPGVVLDDLQRAVAPFGLRFGPDPSTHNRCTLAGMIGNNACGSRALRYGKTDANVIELDVVTGDGARLALGWLGATGGDRAAAGALDRSLLGIVDRYGDAVRAATATPLTRRVSGYGLAALLPEHGGDLARAFVGSEGTCAFILGATVRLVHNPAATALLVLGFPDVFASADAVPELVAAQPITVEGMDRRIVDLAARSRRPGVDLPDGGAYLLVEVDGAHVDAAVARATALGRSIAGPGRSYAVLTGAPATEAWRIREDGAGLATRLADGGEAWPGFEDAAVPPERLGAYLREFDSLLEAHGRRGIPYGHFGEGCVHIRIDFDLLSDAGVVGYRSFLESAADLVVAYGGSLSGEHGDGQARGELLRRMYPPEVIEAFGAFKAAFDPNNVMNPGRMVNPRPLDHDLRVRALRPASLEPTRLALAGDDHDIAAAARRCVGVGRCVRLDGGSMCPSFQVTRAEEHSTRGRARLLSEMLGGDVVPGGWRSSELADALDLCLGCKACRVECPVGVDMAAYRVEFLARHFRHRIRPRAHYAFGGLPLVLRLTAPVAPLVNRALRHRVVGRVLRWSAGIDPAAPLPTLGGRRVRRSSPKLRSDPIVFGDCFSTFADPDVAIAASEALDRLGVAHGCVAGSACCGLTWYSTGQLGIARRVLRRTVRELRRAGDGPIVVLEPSCAAMLREDGATLLGDEIADVAARVVTLGELVEPFGIGEVADHDGPVVAQIHCHAYAGGAYRAELAGLEAIGGEIAAVETACCGLAGNFGLEDGHAAIAGAIADRHIGATLATAPDDATVLADGFSCRTQIEARTGRRTRHFAEILRDALRERATREQGQPPSADQGHGGGASGTR